MHISFALEKNNYSLQFGLYSLIMQSQFFHSIMRTVQNRIFTLILTLLAGFFGAVAPAFSQNAQPVFNSTVDQINCETIRFIHREAGRAEIANNMECFSFESILKSIPEDEARTTAQVAKDIEAFKTKYKADGDLSAQLDNVIAYASKKIEAKPRKGNVADFKLKLQDYKKDAIDNISGTETGANNATTSTPTGGIDEETEETGIVLTDEEETTSAPGDTGWLTYLSLLLALCGLALSAYLFTRLGKLSKELRAARMGAAEPDTNRPRTPQVTDSGANYKLLETKMHQEIARISREFDEKLAAITASTGYTQPESYAQNIAEDEEDDDDIDFLPTPLDQADAPILTTEEFTNEPLIKNVAAIPYQEDDVNQTEEEDEEPLPVVMEEVVDETDEEEEYIEETEEEEDIAEETSYQNTLRSDDSANNIVTPAPQAAARNTAAIDEDEEEGVALPDYKYLGLPLHDGSFAPHSFTDAPTQDSLYEVEMYEDVPNKAFFSPLLYPEIIEKALQDPEKYLAPCCMFLNEPAGKQIITVIEEGRLRRQGERWYIYEKARIRFD